MNITSPLNQRIESLDVLACTTIIRPVILCGGSGTRLWPLSRRDFPKQFVNLIGTESLFQSTARRLVSDTFGAPTVVTGSDFRFLVTEQLENVGICPEAVLIEPEPRNTGPAVIAASVHAAQSDPDALILIAPSDQAIPNDARFREAVLSGVPFAQQGSIVVFGVAPSRAETGYGWLELESASPGPVTMRRFVEKPDLQTAETMLIAGNYLWNAGIFLFAASTMLEAANQHCPRILEAVQRSVSQAQTDLAFTRLEPRAWSSANSISIDYAVMEKASNLVAVPFDGEWDDLGGWNAVAAHMGPDALGVSASGNVTAVDCETSLLRSDSADVELVGIGLSNMVVVAMDDAVLVADRSRTQDVGKAVALLKQRNARQASSFAVDHRPWGYFETLALGERFQVKRIVVHPGAALSLQSHFHRAEHWIVVSGTAEVTVDEDVRILTENESTYIPLASKHRLRNPGKVPMILVEVQTGSYLGEDDIIRYEDLYARGQGAKG